MRLVLRFLGCTLFDLCLGDDDEGTEVQVVDLRTPPSPGVGFVSTERDCD